MLEQVRQSDRGLSVAVTAPIVQPRDRDLERANGMGRVVVGGSGRGTEVLDIYQKFPVRILLPDTVDEVTKEAVVLNCAGGIAGGDRLEVEVVALGNSQITVTSQAAEKIYRALDRPAQIVTKLSAREASKIAWLPQETICFNASRIHRQMEIDLCTDTEVMALEWLVLGRTASGENVTEGHIHDKWSVRRDGRLVWADSLLITDESFPRLRNKALLSKYRAIGTLLYHGPSLHRRLEVLRDVAQSISCICAATIVNGLIIVRFAAETSHDLRSALIVILQCFGREDASGPFRVPKMWSC